MTVIIKRATITDPDFEIVAENCGMLEQLISTQKNLVKNLVMSLLNRDEGVHEEAWDNLIVLMNITFGTRITDQVITIVDGTDGVFFIGEKAVPELKEIMGIE